MGRKMVDPIGQIYPPIPIDTVIEPWGAVVAVGISGTERMYWFKDKHGTISMIPADLVEVPEKLEPLKGTHVFYRSDVAASKTDQ